MLGIFLSIGLLALLIFIYYRSIQYFKINKILKVIGPIILGFYFFGGFITLYIGFLCTKGTYAKQLFTGISYYWLGTLLYFALGLLFSVIIRSIVYKIKNYKRKNVAKTITVIFTLIFTIIMSTYGIMNAHDLKVTNYEIEVNKNSNLDELNIVLIADIHYGYNVGLNETIDMV